MITQLSTKPIIKASRGVYGESGPGNQKVEDVDEEDEVVLVVVNTIGSERFVADEKLVEFV